MADDSGSSAISLADEAETFAQNLAKAVESAGKAVSAYLRPREEGKLSFELSDEMAEMVQSLAAVGQYWISEPDRALEAQNRLWDGYRRLWDSALQRMMGAAAPPIAEPAPGDKRFKDPEWSTNQFFDFIKQLYLITGRWAEEMTASAEGLDDHTRHKARFYMGQLAAAFSPTNFIATNPELIRETIASRGENLARGMKMLAEDIAAGGGNLKIRQTDPSQFELGRNLATAPGKVIFQNQLFQLIQYAPTTDKVLKRPLLIVPPWINKFYILDLTREKSFVQWAVSQGHTVFLVSWVNPGPRESNKTFADYMKEGVITAIDVVAETTGEHEINAIGYCVGGTLLATTLAYLAAHGDKRIRSVTFFAAQVDFTHAGDLQVFIDEKQISSLERQMAVRGYMEGDKMATAFNLLRANDLIWPYIIGNYFQGKEPPPFDILYWNSDSTRLPAANHSFYLRRFYLENRLAKGELEIDGTRIDLKKIRIPVYMLAPREDHIAPAKSVFLGASKFGGKVTFVLSGSGHIAGVINSPSRGKYPFWTGPVTKATNPDDLDAWIAAAEEHPGSWWPHWHAWMEAQDKRRVAARAIGGGGHQPIEDAPGSYVRATSGVKEPA